MERRQRLQDIQEKLRQQALELRAQREQEMKDALEQLKNSALKSLLEGKYFARQFTNVSFASQHIGNDLPEPIDSAPSLLIFWH